MPNVGDSKSSCLNFRLDDVTLNDATLVSAWRKPFDVLAQGLDSKTIDLS